MCGNGARVFARFLVHAGWAQPGRIEFTTRGGVRTADVPEIGDITIGMGPATLGARTAVHVDGVEFKAWAVDVGNPHAVCFTDLALESLDLSRPPQVDAGAVSGRGQRRVRERRGGRAPAHARARARRG